MQIFFYILFFSALNCKEYGYSFNKITENISLGMKKKEIIKKTGLGFEVNFEDKNFLFYNFVKKNWLGKPVEQYLTKLIFDSEDILIEIKKIDLNEKFYNKIKTEKFKKLRSNFFKEQDEIFKEIKDAVLKEDLKNLDDKDDIDIKT